MTYERNGEWGGYKITEAKTGWVLTTWSRRQADLNGQKVLIPYGVWDYQQGQDLSVKHNEFCDVGEAIFEYAMAGENTARLLKRGQKV